MTLNLWEERAINSLIALYLEMTCLEALVVQTTLPEPSSMPLHYCRKREPPRRCESRVFSSLCCWQLVWQPEWCQLVLAGTGGVLSSCSDQAPYSQVKGLLYFLSSSSQYISIHAEGIKFCYLYQGKKVQGIVYVKFKEKIIWITLW